MKSNNNLMQYQLLKLSLSEAKINNFDIKIDHRNGINYVNGIQLGIKYPKSFVEKCNNLNFEKKYKYTFKGGLFCSKSNINRFDLFENYLNRSDSLIINTKIGIARKNKTDFDNEYYQLIANGEYSLCPNWSGSWWDHSNAWTYRVIESCLSRSIPIMFRKTPLGSNFLKDIVFLWDDETHSVENYLAIVDDNYNKAIKYWTLQQDEIEKIKKS